MAAAVILTNDLLHNRNCYAYFLQLKPQINAQIIEFLPQFAPLSELLEKEYSEDIPYGDLYSSIIQSLEEAIEAYSPQSQVLDELIHSIYHNDNHILEADWISELASQARPQMDIGKHIEKKIKNPLKRVNSLSPEDTEKNINRLLSMLSKNYKPQLGTNTPTIKHYLYKYDSAPIEYRFSTQAQRHEGKVRVSPLFKRWLQIQAQSCPTEQETSHIYFNNLGFDRTAFDLSGSKEKQLSVTLHKLEESPDLKVMIITLPAHKGIIEPSSIHAVKKLRPYSSVFKEFFAVAKGHMHQSGVSDLIISQKAKKALFGTDENEHRILKELLERSFQAHGLHPEHVVSEAKKQAVWIHFIKFELTNYILNTIKPNSFNFSCKDAIDRGALSSLYFNLMKSFESNQPMQQSEFQCALDSAATMVKARGMNFHRTILWNALDSYINAHYKELINSEDKSWLIFWRDMNCPRQRVKELLKLRLKQSLHQFEQLGNAENIGVKLLASIEKHSTVHDAENLLLLEAVALTSRLITAPSPILIQKYEALTEELRINHPALVAVYGAMKMLLGIVLYLPTLGYSKNMITQGFAMSKASFFANQRADLCREMQEFTVNCSQ